MDSKNKYIIIVDDNKFFSNVVKSNLIERGYEVKIAENGNIGISLIRERKPILVLLDLIMPIKDGFETLVEIKSDPKLRDVSVVIFSNLSQEKDIREVEKAGALGYVKKQEGSIEDIVDNILEFIK